MQINQRVGMAVGVIALCCSAQPAFGAGITAKMSPAAVPPEMLFDSGPSGRIYVGQTVTLADVFTAGPGPARITAAALSGPDAASYSIASNRCIGAVIDGATSCEIDVLVHATVPYGMLAYINLTTDAGPFQFALPCDTLLHDLLVSPTQIDFGTQPIFTTVSRNIVFTNPNPVAVDLSDETPYQDAPDSNGGFSVNTQLCAHVPANASCSYPVSFTPTAIGPTSGTALPSTSCNDPQNATGCQTAAVSFKGSGVMLDATNVDLSHSFNEYGVAFNDSGHAQPVRGGGLDGLGNVYNQAWNDNTIPWFHQLFTTGPPNALDAVTSQTIVLPAGHYYAVSFLGAAVYGPQTALPFVVSYTDGTRTTVQQSLSDWKTPNHFANEDIVSGFPYRITSDGITQHPGPYYLYGYVLPIDHGKTVSTIELPPTRRAFTLAMNLVSTPVPTPVDLRAFYNLNAIHRDSTTAGVGGIDGQGNALSYEAIATAGNLADFHYDIPAPNVPNAVTRATIALPSGRFTTLRLLGMGVNGHHANQTVVVRYLDGTRSSLSQGFSDWHVSQSDLGRPYAGESTALRMTYRLDSKGDKQNLGPQAVDYQVYEYVLPLDGTKAVASVTTPDTPNVVILAMALEP